MRTFLCGMMILLAASFAAAGQESSGESPIDGERAARVYLGKDVAYYNGGFSFDRRYPSGATEFVSGEFSMYPDGRVFLLTINGQLIVGKEDPPLEGLPQNIVGQTTNYYLWVTGWNDQGESEIYGSFQTNILRTSDPIIILLMPESESNLISQKPPEGVDPENFALRTENGSTWVYQEERGGFIVWADPLEVFEYEVFDASNGVILGAGTFNRTSEDPNEEVPGHFVSFTHQGVQEAFPSGGNFSGFSSQVFDSYVERNGKELPAKVYMTRLGGEEFSAFVQQIEGVATLEIREWRAVGEMPLLSEDQMDYGDDKYFLSVHLPKGYDRIVVVVTGKIDENGFPAFFHRGPSSGKG